MEHPYQRDVDLRDYDGKYLGAVTVSLYRHHDSAPGFLRLAYFENRADFESRSGFQNRYVWSHEFHTDLYSVDRYVCLGANHWSIFRSTRECIMVNKGQAEILIENGCAVAYGIDPILEDVRQYMLDCNRWRS